MPALAEQGYIQHNLVSDISGLADKTSPKLVNAWGLDRSATGPWWVNANGTGLSFVLDGSGAPFPAATPLVVTVAAPPGSTGASAPTGLFFNSSPSFELAPGKPSLFVFATEDGTISGWNPGVDATHSVIKVNNPTAVYKGLAQGMMSGKNMLYAANFQAATVDVFDANFQPVTLGPNAFRDAMVPMGFAPFNVQNIGGSIFVAYAKQDAAKKDEVAGAGLGYVAWFATDGSFQGRLEHGRWMDAPWGIAMAPAEFGQLSGRLLVGNFGSGQIASFDPKSGEFEGMMRGTRGKPITIDGLWGLAFGNGANAGPANVLFFAAGIQDEAHGLFGTLTPVKNKAGDDDDDDRDDDRMKEERK